MPCLIACVFCRLRVEGGEAVGESVGEAVDRMCQLMLSYVKASYTRTARHLLARASTKMVQIC